MEKRGAASYDPGWNDPPLFSYDSQNSQLRASKPRTLLNKRVAFPLHNASPPSATMMPVDPTAPLPTCNMSTLPPPPSVMPQPTVGVPIQESGNEQVNEEFDSSQALETVMTNLSERLNLMFEDTDKNKNDIRRRLDNMKKMWNDNKLNKEVQQKLLRLSEALKTNDADAADDLQKGLMVDHASVCSAWMSGVRHLIHPRPAEQIVSCVQDNTEQL